MFARRRALAESRRRRRRQLLDGSVPCRLFLLGAAITIAANVRSSQSLCVLSLLPPPCLLRRFVLRLRSLSSFRAVRQFTMPVVTNACGFLITYLAAGRPIYDFHGNGIRPLLLLNLFFQYHLAPVSFLFSFIWLRWRFRRCIFATCRTFFSRCENFRETRISFDMNPASLNFPLN